MRSATQTFEGGSLRRLALSLVAALVLVLGICPAFALADEVVVEDESEGTEQIVVQGEVDDTEQVVAQDEVDDTEGLEVQVAPEYYNVWVGDDVQVTSDNCKDVFKDGTVSYDPDSHTLTLNGYTYKGNGHVYNSSEGYAAGIVFGFRKDGKTPTLKSEGENSVKGPNCGVHSSFSLIIDGTGTLEASATGDDKYRNYGINASYDITINGGNVIATGKYIGIHGGTGSSDKIEINGGTVTATGGSYAIDTTTLTIADGISVKAGADEASAKDVDPKEFVTKGTTQYFALYKWAQTKAAPATYKVTVKTSPSAGGTAKAGATKATEGEKVKLTATAGKGYEFDSWVIDEGEGVLGNADSAKTTLTMGATDVTVTAKFIKQTTPKPAKVSGFKTQVHAAKGTIDASWKKAKSAKSYQLAWREAGSSKWQTKKAKGTKGTITGLKAGKLYDVRVRGVNGSTKGAWSKVTHRWFKSASKVKAKAGASNGSVKVSWKKDKSANKGYKVYVYAKKGGKAVETKTVSKSKSSATITGLKSGKTYYIRVRPLKTSSGTTYAGAVSGYRTATAK